MPDNLKKTSLTYYLSEYLEDLDRAGVRDFYRGSAKSNDVGNSERKRRVEPDAKPIVDKKKDAPSNAESSAIRNSDDGGSAAILSAAASSESSTSENAARLKIVAAEVARCVLCPELSAFRTQTVFGSGNPCAELVFVGEGPGADEDAQGLPFVGRSGKLLTDMIEKGMGIPRSSVYICNVVRCRPPQNRNPSSDEARACRPFLDATLDIIKPKFICCLGSIAATNLLGVETSIGKLRGKVLEYRGAKVVCTYHPAYLLRNPPAKKQTWEDLQLLMQTMGLAIPGK